MTVRTDSSGNKKYKKLSDETHTRAHAHAHSYSYSYSQRYNVRRILFNSRLLFRYLVSILDLLKRNRLKAILVSFIAISVVLTLTVSFSDRSSVLSNTNLESDLKSYDNNNIENNNINNINNNNVGDYVYEDISDLDLSDYDLDELYQKGLLVSSQDTNVYDDIFFEDTFVKINRNMTIDELNRRKEEEINRKVAQRVKEFKDAWLKSEASKEKNTPAVQFEDTLEGATAQSLARHGFRPRGSLVMYVSDANIDDIIRTIRSVQSHFNNWVQYPWVLISVDGKEFADTEWVGKLKESNLFNGNDNNNNNINSNEDKTKIILQTVSEQFWGIPEWIDLGKLAQTRNRLRMEPYVESTEYRIWTRYFTGFLPLESFMSNYDWMWYIKPGTELFCDIDYDVFRFMQDSQKLIGLSGSHKVENLNDFEYEKYYKFLKEEHKDIIGNNNLESFLLVKQSNANERLDNCELLVEGFFISNLNFWRSKVYQKYFEIIDKEGTIFHNAWTINKVQTLAITLLMNKKSFQFLDNLGFQNDDYFNCPIDDVVYNAYHCECDQGSDMTFVDNTCSRKFYEILGLSFPVNWDKHTKYLRELKLKG